MSSFRIVADLVKAGRGNEVDSHSARRRLVATLIMIGSVVTLFGVGGAITPTFLTFENVLVVIRQASITGIIALGMSYVTISGNLFALSAEELSVLTACIFGWLMRAKLGLAPA